MKTFPINLTDADVAGIIWAGQTQVRVPLKLNKSVSSHMTPLSKAVRGDLLWGREQFRHLRAAVGGREGISYGFMGQRPAQLEGREIRTPRSYAADRMGREMSRLTLEVVATKTERLWRISRENALHSGVIKLPGDPERYWAPEPTGIGVTPPSPQTCAPCPEEAFIQRWEHLHLGDERERGTEVLAIKFIPHGVNIDKVIEKRAAASQAVPA